MTTIAMVLVICGDVDIATKPVASDRMIAELPNAERFTLTPGGHMALMERNQQFAAAVSTFSDRITVGVDDVSSKHD